MKNNDTCIQKKLQRGSSVMMQKKNQRGGEVLYQSTQSTQSTRLARRTSGNRVEEHSHNESALKGLSKLSQRALKVFSLRRVLDKKNERGKVSYQSVCFPRSAFSEKIVWEENGVAQPQSERSQGALKVFSKSFQSSLSEVLSKKNQRGEVSYQSLRYKAFREERFTQSGMAQGQ